MVKLKHILYSPGVWAFLLIIIQHVFVSCEKRDWDNPYDPEYPKEFFTPNGLTAAQEGESVKITWNQKNTQISGFIISRNENTGPWQEIKKIPRDSTMYLHKSPIGGINYGYRVVAYADKNLSNPMEVSYTPITLPTVETSLATAIGDTSAVLGGNISHDGGSPILERGIIFVVNYNSTNPEWKVLMGNGAGSFERNIANLKPGINYFYRAYARNIQGIAYGEAISFSTHTSLAKLITSAIAIFSESAANVSGSITSDGGLPITQKGLCYSLSPIPTTANPKVILGSGTDPFKTTIKNLQPNTTYYVRAYAINAKGTSYGKQVYFKTDPVLKDVDGNTYKTVIIGDQVWMAENLRTTKYQDGTPIPYVSNSDTWANLKTGAYCFFMNNATNGSIYGPLYNFYAVVDNRKLSPAGWHVPTDGEWKILQDFLGGEKVAGGKLKETGTAHWSSPNDQADNSSGFTALPGSWRGSGGAFYYNVGAGAMFWTSTLSENPIYPWLYSMGLGIDLRRSIDSYFPKDAGCSIRCIKNWVNL